MGLFFALRSWYEEPFAGDWSDTCLFWIGVFFCGCVFGWLYEEVFYFFADGMKFVNRGVLHGPWLPIYGFGALLMTLIVERFRSCVPAVFLGSGIICGLLELAVGFCLFRFAGGMRLWDYNVEPLNWGNVGGFICARSVLFFAFSGLLLVYVANPVCRHLVLAYKGIVTCVLAVLIVLFVADIVITNIIGSSAPKTYG